MGWLAVCLDALQRAWHGMQSAWDGMQSDGMQSDGMQSRPLKKLSFDAALQESFEARKPAELWNELKFILEADEGFSREEVKKVKKVEYYREES